MLEVTMMPRTDWTSMHVMAIDEWAVYVADAPGLHIKARDHVSAEANVVPWTWYAHDRSGAWLGCPTEDVWFDVLAANLEFDNGF